MESNLDKILLEISAGKAPSSHDLLPYLTLHGSEERCIVNAQIAFACLKAGTSAHLTVARDCIQRAWLLSRFDEQILSLFEKIHAKTDDIDSIKEAYKRIGIEKADQGKFNEALAYFDKWQNAYGAFKHLDKFEYDYDILACMERLAAPHRQKKHAIEPLKQRKIRLAYLMRGIIDVNSALVRIDEGFARYHDKSQFEVVYFVAESQSQIRESPQAAATVRKLKEAGCRLIAAPDEEDLHNKFIALNSLIVDYRPDIFITCAAIADFGNCFLAMLSSAPVNVALLSGPPPQFVLPTQDFSVAWIKHPMIDSLVDCNQFNTYPAELPDRANIIPCQRSEFCIPESACVIISAGRTQKFQDASFWNSIARILSLHPTSYFIAVGVSEEYILCIDDALPHNLRSRTRFIAWHANYLSLLAMSDLMIDTYPSGGGGTIFDAMALELPVVSFTNDYLHIFDQTDWSVAEEVICIDELIAPRGDMERFEHIVGRLITDRQFRIQMGAKCAAQVTANRIPYEHLIGKIEALYVKCLMDKLGPELRSSSKVSLDQLSAEWLRYENFQAWQNVYAQGYNAGMGDHRSYFYNQYLTAIGYYEELAKAQRIVEFAPGNGEFIEPEIIASPNKDFWLVDISEKNLSCLAQRFGHLPNVHLILNNQRNVPIGNIHSAFSFLLCQQMPQSLWKEHLVDVYRMLAPGGSYVFQFAYHCKGEFANDSVPVSIAGSQKYSLERMNQIVSEISFREIYFTDEISLQSFNTDVIWHICKVVK